MARTVIHTCDICKSSKSEEDLCHFKINTKGITIKYANYYAFEFDVCKDCLKKKGFIVEDISKMDKEEIENVKNKNALTLEDKIFDILKDMGVMFEE